MLWATPGWLVAGASALLRDLNEHATQPQFDLLMKYNRQTMHCVRRFDAEQVRDMRRTIVAGGGLTCQQAAAG